jgi:hypothetical protein
VDAGNNVAAVAIKQERDIPVLTVCDRDQNSDQRIDALIVDAF